MYIITTGDRLESGHRLALPYQSRCSNYHGHSFRIQVEIGADDLNTAGMVVDFIHTKEALRKYDHKFFVESDKEPLAVLALPGVIGLGFAPTAENLAKYFFDELAYFLAQGKNTGLVAIDANIVSLTIWETESGCVKYTPKD